VKIKAIIFDFDGTLVDTVERMLQLFMEVGQRYGKDLTEDDFYSRNGMTIKEALKRLLKEGKLKWRVVPYLLFNGRKIAHQIHDTAKLYAHVHETLKHLKKHYKIAIVTSNKRKSVEYLCEKFVIREYFTHIITQDDVKDKKPEPEPFLKMAALLNEAPENCLVIEDSPYGVLGANRAAMKTCAVEHTTPKQYFKDDCQPMLFIENLSILNKAFVETNFE